MITLKDAKDELKPYGMTITRKDGEYRVNFAGGDEATAYYTTEIGDAVFTAIDMRHRERSPQPAPWGGS